MFDDPGVLLKLVLTFVDVDSVWCEVGGLGAGALNWRSEERLGKEEVSKAETEVELGDCTLCNCGKPSPNAWSDGRITEEDEDLRVPGKFAGKLAGLLGPGARGNDDPADTDKELGSGSLCKLPTEDGGLRPRLESNNKQ
jgi:hypothetical protein